MTMHRLVYPLSLLVFALAACGGQNDPSPRQAVDSCDLRPLANPTFEITGTKVPPSGHLHLHGQVDELVDSIGRVEITLQDEVSGAVVLGLGFAQPAQVDLSRGTDLDVDYWQRQGFEGTARGIRISDEAGLVLLADDGDYGSAIANDDLAPFSISQADAGCRNKENRPDDLNNFTLVVSSGQQSIELPQSESGILMAAGRDYAVAALRSVSRVGDVSWTDAPSEYVSFVIARVPEE